MMNKQIILCADDFGQNAEISLAILDLAKKKRLSAVSCMVNIPNWGLYIEDLKKTNVQIGLHLNFTFGKPVSKSWTKHVSKNFQGLAQVLRLCYFSRLDQNFFYQEILAQLKVFHKVVGKMPDFIDGHQHIHQLPKIRDALIQAILDEKLNPWFRTTYKAIRLNRFSLKSIVLFFLGGRSFSKLIDKNQLNTNSDFAGDYAFQGKKDYRKILMDSLKKVNDGALVMCHPGLQSQDISDSIRYFRWKEYQYLSGPFFFNDLKTMNIILRP